MKKLGIFNLIKDALCTNGCDCGWNLHIGGKDKEDYLNIKKVIKDYENTTKTNK